MGAFQAKQLWMGEPHNNIANFCQYFARNEQKFPYTSKSSMYLLLVCSRLAFIWRHISRGKPEFLYDISVLKFVIQEKTWVFIWYFCIEVGHVNLNLTNVAGLFSWRISFFFREIFTISKLYPLFSMRIDFSGNVMNELSALQATWRVNLIY